MGDFRQVCDSFRHRVVDSFSAKVAKLQPENVALQFKQSKNAIAQNLKRTASRDMQNAQAVFDPTPRETPRVHQPGEAVGLEPISQNIPLGNFVEGEPMVAPATMGNLSPRGKSVASALQNATKRDGMSPPVTPDGARIMVAEVICEGFACPQVT